MGPPEGEPDEPQPAHEPEPGSVLRFGHCDWTDEPAADSDPDDPLRIEPWWVDSPTDEQPVIPPQRNGAAPPQ